MGKIRTSLRGSLAAVITAATLFAGGLASAGTADAVTSTAVEGTGEITITNVQGQRTYAAIKLADYSAVELDDSKDPATINQISLDEDGIPASLETEVKKALYDVSNGPNAVDTLKFGANDSNPMTWLAQHWLGYPTTAIPDNSGGSNDTHSNSPDNHLPGPVGGSVQQPYNGQLRTFVNNLQKDANFQEFFNGSDSSVPVQTATSTFGRILEGSDGYDGVATFSNLAPGMYLIEETTANDSFDAAAAGNGEDYGTTDSGVRTNTIPMLAGSTVPYKDDLGIAQLALSKFSDTSVPELGTIKTKDDEVSVSQSWVTAGTGQGVGSGTSEAIDVPLAHDDDVWMNIDGEVPTTNGFQHYSYRIIDKPTAGLVLDSSRVVNFTIGDTERGNICKIDSATDPKLTDGSCTSDVYYYQYDANDPQRPGAKDIEFIFPNMQKETPGKKINVGFSLKLVSDSGSEENRTAVAFSNDINAQPGVNTCTSDNTDPTCATAATRINPTPEVIHVYSNTLRLDNVINDRDGATQTWLKGAHFALYSVDPMGYTTPAKFDKVSDGVYRYNSLGSSSSDTPTDLATATTTDAGADIKPGQLKLIGLGGDEFEVRQTQKADDAIGMALAKFDITVGVDGQSGSTWSLDTSKDAWKLVSKHTPFDHISPEHNETAWVDVASVNTMSALPLTGGMGLILAVVLAVLLIAVIVGAAMLRRHVQLTHQK